MFGMGTCVSPSLWTPEKDVKEEKKRKSKPTESMKKWETKSNIEVRPFINDPFLAEGVIEKKVVKPHGVLVMVS